jgi:catalase-peroxidase
VPPPQPFQNPLPAPPKQLADFEAVKAAIKDVMVADSKEKLAPDQKDGKPYYGGVFAYLAYQCASTFRRSDYLGGCNGARIRFAPEKDSKFNTGMDFALQVLAPVKEKFGPGLSWADLIVLAGTTALEEATGKQIPFCGGRTDAANGEGSATLKPTGNFSAGASDLKWKAKMLNLKVGEMVALSAMPRSAKQMERMGFKGSWTTAANISNAYFTTLLNEKWEVVGTGNTTQYNAVGKDVYMTPMDMAIKDDADLKAAAQQYAADNDLFLKDLTGAWVKVMNNDRFDGPTGNVCDVDQVKFYVVPFH